MAKIRSIGTLIVDSTILCCNFVNTVSSWKTKDNYDYLVTYDDFIEWCLKLKVSDVERLQMFRELAKDQPEEALAALNRIKEIRQVLQGLLSAVAQNDTDKKHTFLPAANLLLIDAASRQRLLYSGGRFVIDQIETAGDLMAPAWKAVHSLADLLTGHDNSRIKECPKCGWVFLDETKNGRRKWCNSKVCGSTDKMMRYNQRKKQQNEDI
ncbi:MAG TPA: CGNR zinc finger domain-containing protein [Niabella sp.]|nr:CGNR zinc finger domain-containing protein [Niabella sp.]